MWKLDKAIQDRWRSDGFTGGGRHFRRLVNPYIHCISIQRHSACDRFCIEYGVSLDFLHRTAPEENFVEYRKTTAYHCLIGGRLESSQCDHFHWWMDESYTVDAFIEAYEQQAVPLFDFYSDFPNPFYQLDPSSAEHWMKGPYMSAMQIREIAWFAGQVSVYLGDEDRAWTFFQTGLSAARSEDAGDRGLIAALERALDRLGGARE